MVTRRNILVGVAAGGGVMMVPRSTLAAENAATLDANKAVVKRYIDEVVNAGKVDVVDEIVAGDYRLNGDAAGPDLLKSRAGASYTMLHDAFSDFAFTINELVAEGNTVAARLTFRGTQTGPFAGIPPTGKKVENLSLSFFALTNGQVAEEWTVSDVADVLRQLQS